MNIRCPKNLKNYLHGLFRTLIFTSVKAFFVQKFIWVRLVYPRSSYFCRKASVLAQLCSGLHELRHGMKGAVNQRIHNTGKFKTICLHSNQAPVRSVPQNKNRIYTLCQGCPQVAGCRLEEQIWFVYRVCQYFPK